MEETFKDKLNEKDVTFSFGVDRFLEDKLKSGTVYDSHLGYNDGGADIGREGSQDYTLSEKEIKSLEKNGVLKKKGEITPYRYEWTEGYQGSFDRYGKYGGKGENNLVITDMGDKLGVIATYEITEAARWDFSTALGVLDIKVNGQELYPHQQFMRKEIEGNEILPVKEDETGERTATRELIQYGIYDENGIREATPKEIRDMSVILKEKAIELFEKKSKSKMINMLRDVASNYSALPQQEALEKIVAEMEKDLQQEQNKDSIEH